MPEYAPTIFDCKDISGHPFQLTAKEPRSMGRERFGVDKFLGGAKLRLVDPLRGDRDPGNVEIRREGEQGWTKCGDYNVSDDNGNGPFTMPKKNRITGEIERWPDSGKIKSESKIEWVVVIEADFGQEIEFKRTGGKRAGESCGTARVWDVWMKLSAYKKLREQMDSAAKMAGRDPLEARYVLTYTKDAAPADMYQVKFDSWAEKAAAKPQPEPGSFRDAAGEDMDVSLIPF
jgi:hypothetical protein